MNDRPTRNDYDQLIDQLGDRCSRLRGIGIGSPGLIDLKSGMVMR